MRTPTPEDLSILPTRGEIVFDLPNVTWPDGRPVQLTLRALSAADRLAIDRAASAVGGAYDDTTALVETVYHGIAAPKLEDEQKLILWRWNVWLLEQIADQIEILGRLPARDLQAALERLADAAIPAPTARKGGAGRRRRRDQPAGIDSGAAQPDVAADSAGDRPAPARNSQ